jgi:hypothetical protein
VPETQPQDATAEFYSALNDPSRWIIKRGVPVFKAHERVDPATGKQIKVDLPKLYRIANNMQQLERGGVPIRMTLGHTEPGKPEHQQPPVGGYYRNPRVQPFGPKGEPAVVVDEWLDPQYGQNRKNYPYRSAEYYDDAEQITGVALLTRDPYLDLGVVAYGRGEAPTKCSVDGGLIAHTTSSPVATMYGRNPATGQFPVMYRLTLGELPMYPPGNPQPQAAPQYPQPQPHYPQPQPPVPGYSLPPAGPLPTPYSAPSAAYAPPPTYAPPAPYPYPVPAPVPYSNRGMSRPRTSNQWLYGGYGGTPYAGPEDMAGGAGGGGGGPMGALQAVYEGLSQALQALQSVMEESTSAPQSPFPGGGGDGNPMTPAARYAMGHRGGRGDVDRRHFQSGVRDMNQAQRRGMRQDDSEHRLARPRNPDGERGYARYERGQEPLRTISGQPVGQQLLVDRLNYQLAQQNQALRMLMYERDERDSEACVAEIRRLVADGFLVGEEELRELKAKRPEERGAFLQNIVTKYQKVPTDQPPPIPGDPTPAPEGPSNAPITKEQMEQALQYANSHPEDPNGYNTALNYMRSGAQPTPTAYNHPAMAGIPPFRRSFPPPEAAGPYMNHPADFGDPYPENNGQY